MRNQPAQTNEMHLEQSSTPSHLQCMCEGAGFGGAIHSCLPQEAYNCDIHTYTRDVIAQLHLGWLRWVVSFKFYVSFDCSICIWHEISLVCQVECAKYRRLLCRALLQKRPMNLSILLSVASPLQHMHLTWDLRSLVRCTQDKTLVSHVRCTHETHTQDSYIRLCVLCLMSDKSLDKILMSHVRCIQDSCVPGRVREIS